MVPVLRGFALVVVAFAVVGCGAEDPAPAPASTTAPPTKAAVLGTAPQPTPEALYAEYVTRMGKVDGPGVCALFTEGGAVTFEDEWQEMPCELVVTKAAGKIPDLKAFAANTTPKSNTPDSATVVELSGCGVGGMKALKSDKGWLIDAYRRPEAVTGC